MDEAAITPALLLQAYAAGIFPMAPDQDSAELEWYDPPLRGILPLHAIHLSRSLVKTLRGGRFRVTINRNFTDVMSGCAARAETWISDCIIELYTTLHRQGHAHSIEVWQDGALVGGAYGVALGRAFFGESMFSRVPDASKIALAHLLARLIRQNFTLCDTQYLTDHLATFGGIEIPRTAYQQQLAAALAKPAQFASVSSGIGSSVATGEDDVAGAAVAALLVGAASTA